MFSSPDVNRVIKMHVETQNQFNNLVKINERKALTGRRGHRRESSIKMDLR
jgi:hypothetical protein